MLKIKNVAKFMRDLDCDIYEGTYEPSLAECNRIFDLLNKSIFNNKLPRPRFKVRRLHKAWGECVGFWIPKTNPEIRYSEISINYKYPSPQMFIATLAHELVHHWQWITIGEMTHGKSFSKWKPIFHEHCIPLTSGLKKNGSTLNWYAARVWKT